MPESKHTQGPWVALPEEIGRSYIRVRGTLPGTRFKVANVLMHAPDGMSATLLDRETSEVRANARLIAAAPALLAALRDTLALIRNELPESSKRWVLGRADDAVAKVIGSES